MHSTSASRVISRPSRGATRRPSLRSGARRRFAGQSRAARQIDLGEPEEPADRLQTRASWRYLGSGYRTKGEAWLAMLAAARAREYRRLAREHACIDR
jgi:hypothetical protein